MFLIQKAADLAAEGGSGIAVAHDHEHGIVTGQGAEDHAHIHGVDGGGSGAGQTRHGLDDDHVLGVVKAGDALPEDGIQTGREGMAAVLAGGGIAVGAEGSQLLDDPQLLDVTGNGGLGGLKTGLLE